LIHCRVGNGRWLQIALMEFLCAQFRTSTETPRFNNHYMTASHPIAVVDVHRNES